MIDKNVLEYLKKEFRHFENINLSQFKNISNDQLKAAINSVYPDNTVKNKNIFNIIDYLATHENDLEKRACILGFKSYQEQQDKINSLKERIKSNESWYFLKKQWIWN